MDAVAESGRDSASKNQIQPECREWVDRRGTGRQDLSRETRFSGGNEDRDCSADHEQDKQPYMVDPYSAESADQTYCAIRCYER